MKLIYCAPNLLLVKHFQNLLEAHGIGCIVKNENLNSAAGELPPTECWPELWLTDEANYGEAARLLFSNSGKEIQPSWTCPRCDEWLEGQFNQCWNCGEYRIS
ncbi:putative signal transducing protein [Nitrosococcus oceani]|uniref:putative signal transducing protein n=1 Tax=Nitrosococcus oceani TaxID=1229 RepID=UPI0004E8AFB2|nr:DUF2007 domain-containing protein [Nitrosococcus oceani]KFI23752.1 hypothetical protein HW44_01925 [Nitrosococcus oceani]